MTLSEFLREPVCTLAGVGPAKEKALARLGIATMRDLLTHFPRAYQNRADIRLLADAADGQTCALRLTVGSNPVTDLVRGRARMTITRFTAFDESGSATVTFFNSSYVERIFRRGDAVRFFGKVKRSRYASGYELTSPAFEKIVANKPLPAFVAVYPLNAGISAGIMTRLIRDATARGQSCGGEELIPPRVREETGLPSFWEAVRGIHSPRDYAELDRARNYFAFEELYLYTLARESLSHARAREPFPRLAKPSSRPFLSRLPFALTGAQSRAIREIVADLTSPDATEPMNRLLSGDVGSGKTVCAAAAVYVAAKNSLQSALMAPTEILARQHYADLTELFSPLGIRVGLLLGGLPAAEKRRVKEETRAGRLDLVIGTHALLTADTVFARLGLVITDEQHRFGVAQRAALSEKGAGAHTLVMTATPIPRTLALILYGNLAISRLDELPPGRQKVDTFVVDESYRARLTAFIAKQVSEGHRVYVVCPAVDSEEKGEGAHDSPPAEEEGTVPLFYRPGDEPPPRAAVKDVLHFSSQLQEMLPRARVGILHGQMKGEEKEAAMNAFTLGEVQVLVSTTVVEVGVNNPLATLMVVENADRFGLAALHQLRGRVGRGRDKSYCILVTDAPAGSAARERLDILRRSSDGFAIAEEDLRERGPGDFLPGGEGTRQHGDTPFRMAQHCTDLDLLKAASDHARAVVRDDPTLSKEENAMAGQMVRERVKNAASREN